MQVRSTLYTRDLLTTKLHYFNSMGCAKDTSATQAFNEMSIFGSKSKYSLMFSGCRQYLEFKNLRVALSNCYFIYLFIFY